MKIANQDKWIILPFRSTSIKNKKLVSNVLGHWDFLTDDEFKCLHSMNIAQDSPLFCRLKEKGLIVDDHNIKQVIQNFRNSRSHLFQDASLHIAVVTTQCNQQCLYCQAKTDNPQDMTLEVASRILKYITEVRTPLVTIELQGGEPLLNWPVVQFLIEKAQELLFEGRKFHLTVVSNLTLLDDEKLSFFMKYNVDICTSFDGVEHVHNQNRIFLNGRGTYQEVVQKIRKIQSLNYRCGLLPTITKSLLPYPKELIDSYIELQQYEVPLRSVSCMGEAQEIWDTIGYSVDDFMKFYEEAIDYMLELNQKGIMVRERMMALLLKQILLHQDHGYVDCMNPCGAGRTVMTYMPDGGCYPCDESRMIDPPTFQLGNILEENYEDMIKKDKLLHILTSSCSDLWHYGSAFSPWLGVCPMIHYAKEKNLVLKTQCSFFQDIQRRQLKLIFEKLADEKQYHLLMNWVKGDYYEKSKSSI